jgi:hypothetical protein
MFKNLFGRNKPERAQEVDDPVLGKLVASDEGDWWTATVNLKNRQITFSIRGETTPDPPRIDYAREIISNYDEFEKKVMGYLAKEAQDNDASGKEWKMEMAAEIRKLVIEDISLTHPKNLRDGMVFFSGPNEFRAWRCDLVNGEPKFLGFDD